MQDAEISSLMTVHGECSATKITGRQDKKIPSVWKKKLKNIMRLNNLALENAPEDLVITTHVCRGNYHSTWASSGGYRTIAPFLFANENVSAYYLELMMNAPEDLNHSALFPMIKSRTWSCDQQVTDFRRKEVIKKRIAKAAKYIPLDRLYLSPQCGFASCEIGNKLTEEEQWAKLALVKEIAKGSSGVRKIILAFYCFFGEN